jgi:hemerythrin
MRAARYPSFQWHKRSHDNARRRMAQFMGRLEQGEATAGAGLVEYLTSWLRDHTRLADMMLGAFLRNHRRGLYKVSFRAGTKPIDACEWVNSKGEKFDPPSSRRPC